MKKVLVVGKNGSIAKDLINYLNERGEFEVVTTSSSDQSNTNTYKLVFDEKCSIPDELLSYKFDHIIIGAGYEPQSNLFESELIHIHKMFNIHVIGPMILLQKLIPNMNDNGSIVLFSSPAAQKGSYDPSYSAVKGAINSLVKTLAKDVGPKLRVNAISPSLVTDSTVFKRMTEDFRLKHLNNTLTKKNTTTLDCIHAIVYLMNGNQVTGQVLQVNGGMI